MSRSNRKITPNVVMIGAALALASCAGEAADYGYPGYYYDEPVPYGGIDFDYGGCCFGGRFHHDFAHRIGHEHSVGHGFDHAGRSFGGGGHGGGHGGGR